jgi:hypothetical protein
MRESTSRNQANGSTPDRLQEAMKLRNTAAGREAVLLLLGARPCGSHRARSPGNRIPTDAAGRFRVGGPLLPRQP